jgi:glutamate synthase domain-containing protein 2
MKNKFTAGSLLILFFIVICTWVDNVCGWLLLPYALLVAAGVYDMMQVRHSLRRNYPIIGRMRWLLEMLRPPVRQYFIESDIDGVPISRMLRGLVYRRSKKELDTVPFGTKMDVYAPGYEWISHSLRALSLNEIDRGPRVTIGSAACIHPYSASLLNVSAMSFGALSRNAVRSLAEGAKRGGFAVNTGEGGLSPYHIESGADLIWQIGTGYFSCRTKSGSFSPEKFAENARFDQVKMIEIKLSQGAKPGHGGILPAEKNTPEIAAIRGVKPYTQVDSPPVHSAFSTPMEMMEFIQNLRELSGGKPIGFKLAVGRKSEFIALCKAMVKTGTVPDFITVDGGEGGTGAAPLEHTNSVGMPLREALAFVSDCLIGFNLKKEIKIIASGKILTGMDIAKVVALGADLCASARGFMLSMGCIQALQCHKNRCPTGIATQNPQMAEGLVVTDKKVRVSNYHEETIRSFLEILASAGLRKPDELDRSYIYQRINRTDHRRYDEFFPPMTPGALLKSPYPEKLARYIEEAVPERF